MNSSEEISLTRDQIKKQEPDKKILFIDVREQWERDVSHIPGSLHLPLSTLGEVDLTTLSLEQYDWVVIYCAHGIRSLNAAHYFRMQKIGHCFSLQGGIAEWD
jgi:rhodanese-related sulfurtransferase